MGKKDIKSLVSQLVLSSDLDKKASFARDIFSEALGLGIYPSSAQQLYKACAEGKCGGFTVPAVNLRMLTFDVAKAVFRAAKKNHAGAFMFEISKPEMDYTGQCPLEFTGALLAAAVEEKFEGPVFIQGDHVQVGARRFALDPEKEMKGLKDVMAGAMEAGFYNIVMDFTNLISQDNVSRKERQRRNFETCALMTRFIRQNEPSGIKVSLGAVIGDIEGMNEAEETLRGFMEGYWEGLPAGMDGLSKISVQAKAAFKNDMMHKVNPAGGQLNFEALGRLSAVARNTYSLGGLVHDGLQALPMNDFGKFVEAKVLEVRLATQFQDMILDSSYFPKDLKEKMYLWVKKTCQKERKEDQPEDQFLCQMRRKSLGFFKEELMNLPEEMKENLTQEVEARLDFLFKQLKVRDTAPLARNYAKPAEAGLTGCVKASALNRKDET